MKPLHTPLLAKIFLPLASFVLMSCGGGNGTGTGGASGEGRAYTPMAIGDTWVYAKDCTACYSVVTVDQAATVHGVNGFALKKKDIQASTAYTVETAYYVANDDGLMELIPETDDLSNAGHGTYALKFPLVVGQSYERFRTTISIDDVDGDGQRDSAEIRMWVTVEDKESITTKAGAFTDTFRVKTDLLTIIRSTQYGEEQAFVNTGYEWYAKNIGLIKSIDKNGAKEELIEYKVGSNFYPEKFEIKEIDPVDKKVTSFIDTIKVNLSGVVNLIDMPTEALQISHSDGSSFLGQINFTETGIEIRANKTWAQGTYDILIGADVQDFLGRKLLSNYQSNFTLDQTAPTVLSVSPISGAIGVPVNESITIDFSENFDPASLYTGKILRVISNDTNSSTSYDYYVNENDFNMSVSGSKVTITPKNSWLPDSQYYVSLQYPRDFAGNEFYYFVSTNFTTSRADFAYIKPIPGIPNDLGDNVLKIADMDGDGIDDLVTDNINFLNKINIYYGTSTGAYLSPITIEFDTCGADPECTLGPISNVNSEDVDGDGKKEIIIHTYNYSSYSVKSFVFKQSSSHQITQYFTHEGLIHTTPQKKNGVPLLFVQSASTNSIYTGTVQNSIFTKISEVSFGDSFYIEKYSLDFFKSSTDYTAIMAASRINRFMVYEYSINANGLLSQKSSQDLTPQLCPQNYCSYMAGIHLKDVSSDGLPDLVTFRSQSDNVTVSMRQSNGTFSSSTITLETPGVYKLLIEDLNRDGKNEIIVFTNYYNLNTFVFHQNNLGAFNPPKGYFQSGHIESFALHTIYDVNKDGLKDIVVGTRYLEQLPAASTASGRKLSLGASLKRQLQGARLRLGASSGLNSSPPKEAPQLIRKIGGGK